MPIQICKYCGEKFIQRKKSQLCCTKKECKNALARERYNNTWYNLTCIQCGKEFESHVTFRPICRECAENNRHDSIKEKVPRYIKVHVCKHCGAEISREEKIGVRKVPLTENNEFIIDDKVCDACKKKNYEKFSERMKLNNPNFNTEQSEEARLKNRILRYAYLKEKSQTFENQLDDHLQLKDYTQVDGKIIEEIELILQLKDLHRKLNDKNLSVEEKQLLLDNEEIIAGKLGYKSYRQIRCEASTRMKLNNPMFKAEVREKVSQTVAQKKASGEYIHKKGPEHANWKGGKGAIKSYLRINCKDWRIEALKNANYSCQNCGKSRCHLHVHHIKPFIEILNEGLAELQLDIKNMRFRDPDYNKLEEWILHYHATHDIALVLCEECHDLIDEHFHKSKNI